MHLFCRCKQLVINCKTVNLDNKTSEQLYSNYLVCGEHFEDRMFMNPITRNSLVHNAIPTVFAFPGGFTSSTASTLRKRKEPTQRHARAEATTKQQKLEPCSVAASASISLETESSTLNKLEQLPEDADTPRKKLLKSKLALAQSAISRARVTLFRMRKAAAASAMSEKIQKQRPTPIAHVHYAVTSVLCLPVSGISLNVR